MRISTESPNVIAALLAVLFFAPVATAQETAPVPTIDDAVATEVLLEEVAPEPSSSAPAAAIDRQALETFIDGIMATALQDQFITGAVISVVSAEDTLLLKGYGLADSETDTPVDPNIHLFRIASISKLFTATSIMQLVEQGKVDLDADIRTYLGDLGFDDSKGAITTADLLTHTAGFEDRIFGFYGETPELEDLPREEHFARLAPTQVRAPGELVSYSNYSYSLLGEIIARVSGKTYAEYIREEIFQPLGMERSTVVLKSLAAPTTPEIEALREDESKSHRWDNGWYDTQSFPSTIAMHEAAGTISTTAADISSFMHAHLNNGAFEDSELLQPETADRMHSVLFSHIPGVNGNAHGFWVLNIGGYDVIEHGGSINDFRSTFVLFPELGLGVFISGNTASSGILGRIPDRIVEHFFPKEDKGTTPDAPVQVVNLEEVSGKYLTSRRNQTRFGKIANVVSTFNLSATDDGDILMSGGSRSIRFKKDGDGVFRSLRDGSIISFGTGEDGTLSRVFFGNSPYSAYEKLTFENRSYTFIAPTILAALAGISVIVGYALPFMGFRRNKVGKISLVERGVVAGVSLLILAFILHTGLTLLELAQNENIVYKAYPTPAFRLVFVGAWVIAILSVALAATNALALAGHTRTNFQKVRLTGFTLIVLLFVWMLFQWNVIGL
ncbi:MAG: serine hydrolase [Pseudomonadota bacterium]